MKPLKCPSCNSDAKEGAKFCGTCGGDLSLTTVPLARRQFRWTLALLISIVGLLIVGTGAFFLVQHFKPAVFRLASIHGHLAITKNGTTIETFNYSAQEVNARKSQTFSSLKSARSAAKRDHQAWLVSNSLNFTVNVKFYGYTCEQVQQDFSIVDDTPILATLDSLGAQDAGGSWWSTLTGLADSVGNNQSLQSVSICSGSAQFYIPSPIQFSDVYVEMYPANVAFSSPVQYPVATLKSGTVYLSINY